MTAVPVRTEVLMGTLVTIDVLRADADAAIDRAFHWFREIESRCSRFDEHSELMQLTARVGEPVAASPMLFEAVRFALCVAEDTGGAFDPTMPAKAFQPKCISIYRVPHLHFSATISTGGAAKCVSVPPTETFTKRSPSVP